MVSIKKNFIFFTILGVFSALNSFSQNDVQKNNELITRVSKIDSASTKKKIIPIAIPITEPAVGYGLVAGLMYFLPKEDPKLQSDMIVGAAGLTTNGTWFAGGGYLGFWKEDNLKYTALLDMGKSQWIIMGLVKITPFNSSKMYLCFYNN
jgi:hypothetical protein